MGKWVIAVFVAVMAFIQWNSGRAGRAFERAAEAVQQRTPFEVVPGIRIDKASFDNKVLLLQMTFLDEATDQASARRSQTDYLLKTVLTKAWCADKALRAGIDAGYVMSAQAKRINGTEITQLNVDREACICAQQGGDYCVIR